MFRKILLIKVFVLSSIFAYSQIPDFNMHLYPCPNIHFNGEYYINSDNVNNNFIYDYYKGGFLNRDIRTEQWDDLKSSNIIGNKSRYSAFYTEPLDSLFGQTNLFFTAVYAFDKQTEIQFTDDLFHLIMFGNKPTAGSYMDIGNSSYTTLKQQYFKIGLAKTFQQRNIKHRVNFMVGFHIGQNYQNIVAAENTQIFTDTSGTFIDINAPITYTKTHSTTDKFRIASSGFSLNLSYDLIFKKHHFFLAVENMGYHFWNQRTEYYDRDTSFTFYGIEIADITTVDSLSFPQVLNDYGIETEKGKRRIAMPMHIRLGWEYQSFSWLKIRFMFSHYLHSIYKPQIRFEPEYIINEQTQIYPIISYGGYSDYNIGIGLKYYIENWDVYIEARSEYIDGIVFPNTNSGIGGQIKIAKYLGKCYSLRNTQSSFL